MSIERIDRDEVATRAVSVLGLDAGLIELLSIEGVCASLRRAASFLCPASPRQLVDAVLDALTPLRPDFQRDHVDEALKRLIATGDLLELSEADTHRRLLYLGPPSYVEKHPGHFLLLGIRPNADPLIDAESLGAAVTHKGHIRTITLDTHIASEALAAAGLQRLTRKQWARAPRQDSAATVVDKARARLRRAGGAGRISGLTVIDSTKSVRYYKGRWREPLPTDQGMFLGRRPQAYGARIWCLVDLADGFPRAALDLPVDASAAPGWDEGRRLQAAIDAHRGSPQVFRSRPTGVRDDTLIFDFFGPLPSWAERYLDLVGLPVTKSQGALFSYRVPGGAGSDTRAFLSDALWMLEIEEVQGT